MGFAACRPGCDGSAAPKRLLVGTPPPRQPRADGDESAIRRIGRSAQGPVVDNLYRQQRGRRATGDGLLAGLRADPSPIGRDTPTIVLTRSSPQVSRQGEPVDRSE